MRHDLSFGNHSAHSKRTQTVAPVALIANPPAPIRLRPRIDLPFRLPPHTTRLTVVAMRADRTSGRSSPKAARASKLARDLKRGRDDAIDRIYDEYGATTYGFLRSMLRDDHAAEDVQQQVYLEAWQKADAFDPARGSLLSWLLAIARSRGLDHFRRRTPEPVDPTDPGTATPDPRTDGEIDGLIEQWRVSHLLARIPREEAEMLRLRFYEDLSQSQIAERTGIPLGTVKLRMVNGLARLRGELEAEGDGR